MSYEAPVDDMMFVLTELAGLEQMQHWPQCENASIDTVQTVLLEHSKLASEVLAPLNRMGDVHGANWSDGCVTTAPGFSDAFKAYANGGWQGLVHDVEFGGQGLPKIVAAACTEMANAANLSFALCPLLTDGVIQALITAGSSEQKNAYIPKLISGQWAGTMNLTEPQAGSDLSAVRTKAVPHPDGSYRLFGQKIYITYGEHDLTENIVHMVLARTVDAPAGVKGLSLFIVPKFLSDPNGALGAKNDVYCASLEHKLGIKASPTAVLIYGDGKGEVGLGAVGYLVGQENCGLEYMFIMMNAARFAVGLQGIGVADCAYQAALAYAKGRMQGRPVDGTSALAVTIDQHPDVKRMLFSMRAHVEGARGLALVAAAALDAANHCPDAQVRNEQREFYEFLVPVVKGWSTEMAIEVASTAIQVHGGMGFIEETGVAQYYRDARILTIYEGTTAIQANDLIGRKTYRDQGAVAKRIVEQIKATELQLGALNDPKAMHMLQSLQNAREAFLVAIDFIIQNIKHRPNDVYAASVPYLKLVGITLCGWQLARAYVVAHQKFDEKKERSDFYAQKKSTAYFFSQNILNVAPAMSQAMQFSCF